ncbi:AI-2E family transporter [Salimicrobium halophilum]|uniref:Predicted PurR-regulated permease PerM n=1 Tax=Salimicrobium halophilum TaxID=86666 RepID=A0A1G8SRY0_9BACI|nr:AI-2E family transporter [Salimicrobium halophilum]SDJ32006.1 Predicted PurR-regulated permease PerM [Salimicrobium halophilum]
MLQKKWFQLIVAAIAICLLIFLLHEIQFFFQPILTYISAIAIPLIGGGVLYYISRPLVEWLVHNKVPKVPAILVVFVAFIAAGYFIVQFIAPIAQQQYTRLMDNIPEMVRMVEEWVTYWQQNQDIMPDNVTSAIQNFTDNLQSYLQNASAAVISVLTNILSFLFSVVLVPFFLFFMLKDGERLLPFLTGYMSEKSPKFAKSFERWARSVDHTLYTFILGQLTVSVAVGVLLLIGYMAIGLHYSLTLALFAMLMNVIPFIGPFLAVIPALLVALFQDPIMVVWVAIITLIAQQIEGNLISPNIMGKALHIHPLTIITVVLAAGSLAGFLGLLFAIPTYAVIKATIKHFYEEWKNGKAEKSV